MLQKYIFTYPILAKVKKIDCLSQVNFEKNIELHLKKKKNHFSMKQTDIAYWNFSIKII